MFHRHNWNLIDKQVIPPAIASIPAGTKAWGSGMDSIFDALREHVVYVFKCDCGKVKVNR